MNPYQYMLLEAQGLDIGGSTKVWCPFCQAKHEDQLSLTRVPEGVLYHCFRASCPAHGIVPSGDTPPRKCAKKERVFKKFTDALRNPVQWELDLLEHKYGILPSTVWHHRWKTTKDSRLWMPVRNHLFRQVGVTTKSLTGEHKPKAMHYPFGEDCLPFQHFFFNKATRDELVVVEDMFSAARYAQLGYMSCALLGTVMNDERAMQIARCKPMHVFVSLDPDATDKAHAIVQKYHILFDGMSTITLPADPKDCTDIQLKEALGA